jgi:hypothetical protein
MRPHRVKSSTRHEVSAAGFIIGVSLGVPAMIAQAALLAERLVPARAVCQDVGRRPQEFFQ